MRLWMKGIAIGLCLASWGCISKEFVGTQQGRLDANTKPSVLCSDGSALVLRQPMLDLQPIDALKGTPPIESILSDAKGALSLDYKSANAWALLALAEVNKAKSADEAYEAVSTPWYKNPWTIIGFPGYCWATSQPRLLNGEKATGYETNDTYRFHAIALRAWLQYKFQWTRGVESDDEWYKECCYHWKAGLKALDIDPSLTGEDERDTNWEKAWEINYYRGLAEIVKKNYDEARKFIRYSTASHLTEAGDFKKWIEETRVVLEKADKISRRLKDVGKDVVLDTTVTRAQFAAILCKQVDLEQLWKNRGLATPETLEKIDPRALATDYKDHRLAGSIDRVVRLGVPGLTPAQGNHTFEPERLVTRAEAAFILANLVCKLEKRKDVMSLMQGVQTPVNAGVDASDVTYSSIVFCVCGHFFEIDPIAMHFNPKKATNAVDVYNAIMLIKDNTRYLTGN